MQDETPRVDPRFEHMTDDDYHALWKELGPIEIRMVSKAGPCKHETGDTFYYEHPYARPQGVCTALLNVLDHYTWRTAMGFPSWESDDRARHLIHCPDKDGTVWSVRKVER